MSDASAGKFAGSELLAPSCGARWAQLKASLFCIEPTPHPGGGSIGVVEPVADGTNGDVPNEVAKPLLNGDAPNPLPALDE